MCSAWRATATSRAGRFPTCSSRSSGTGTPGGFQRSSSTTGPTCIRCSRSSRPLRGFFTRSTKRLRLDRPAPPSCDRAPSLHCGSGPLHRDRGSHPRGVTRRPPAVQKILHNAQARRLDLGRPVLLARRSFNLFARGARKARRHRERDLASALAHACAGRDLRSGDSFRKTARPCLPTGPVPRSSLRPAHQTTRGADRPRRLRYAKSGWPVAPLTIDQR